MHEKHYIHEIVVGFLTNSNFSIEEYVKLINKSHLKYSKRLLTYKAFKKFKEDKELTEQKIINYSKGNILTALFSASPSSTETEIRTYCEKNKGSLACSCYEAVKVGADKYQMTYDKYKEEVKRISAINKPIWNKYITEYKEYEKRLDTYLNNLRNYEKSSDEMGPCCAWNYCECTPTDTWTFSRTGNYGLFGCSKYCKYTQKAIKSMENQYTKTHEPKQPYLEEYPDRPAKVTINTNCCVNVIDDVKNINNVVQSCNQNIISIIKTEKEKRKKKEEEERKKKEEEERKRKEEEDKEPKKKEEKDKEEKDKEEEDKEPKKKEDDKKENNQIKNIIYISIGASFILLLLFILLRKK